jgi:hypothetical protein
LVGWLAKNDLFPSFFLLWWLLVHQYILTMSILLQNSIFLGVHSNRQHENVVSIKISGQFLLKCLLLIL